MESSIYLPLIDRLKNVAETHFKEQKYEEFLEDFKTIFPCLGFKTEFKYYSMALGSYKQVIKNVLGLTTLI